MTTSPCILSTLRLRLQFFSLRNHDVLVTVSTTTLSDYAANLLAALRDLDLKSNIPHFVIFVTRSCLPQITLRLNADLYIFRWPLDDILDGWLPGPRDTLAPKQVRLGYWMLKLL